MTDRYAQTWRVRERRRAALQRLRSIRWLPLGAALFPFLPAPVYAAIGAIGGFFAARWRQHIQGLNARPEPVESQSFQDREDSGPPESIYLGQAIPFLSYKAGVEQLREKYGFVPPKVRRSYDDEIIKQMRPLMIGDKELCSHLCVMASPGQGKTELLKSIAYQQINRGGSIIVYDPKSDENVWLEIAEMADKANRMQDLRYFNPDRHTISHSYNPLLYGGARHTVATGMKLTSTPTGGDNEFFYRMTRIGMLAAVVCLKAQPVWTPISFRDLAPLFTDLSTFISLWNKIPPQNAQARNFVYQFLKIWTYTDKNGALQIDEKRYGEIQTGLTGMVMDFCHSEYADLLNSHTPDIVMDDVLSNGRILYAGFSALTDKQGSSVFGRLFLADLGRAMGEIYREKHRPAVPAVVYMDEYSSSADASDSELLQLGRAAKIPIILNLQGRGFLDSVNTTFTSQILDTTANHLFMRVASKESRETAANLAGSTITRFAQTAEGTNFNEGFSNYETGLFSSEGHGRSVSEGSKETREELIQPEDLNMEKGDGILMNASGVYRMRLPLVTTQKIYRDASEVPLPQFMHRSVKGLNLMASSANSATSRTMAALGEANAITDDD